MAGFRRGRRGADRVGNRVAGTGARAACRWSPATSSIRSRGWSSSLITVWSALLPNLIADRPIVPEFYNRLRPARQCWRASSKQLFADTPLRAWQKDGFAEVARRMATARPSGEIAAEIVLQHVEQDASSEVSAAAAAVATRYCPIACSPYRLAIGT